MSNNSIVGTDKWRFFQQAHKRAKMSGERLGQAMFNHLYELRPDLANKARGTDMDPFYVDSSHPNWMRFVDFINESDL